MTRALQAAGHRVRALVRDPNDSRAAELVAAGINVVEGDLNDVSSLTDVAQGVTAIFLVTTPAAGTDVEAEHGMNMIAAAENAGVEHMVFSSVASANQYTGIPHFDSKAVIEKALRLSRLKWTITAPVFFYDNVEFPWNQADIAEGRFRQALPPGRRLQQLSLDDVGRFNALALELRSALEGQRIEIAADELTGPAMAKALSQVLGRPVQYEEQTLEEVREQFADMATMYEWLDREGFRVDMDALHRRFPDVPWTPFAAWARSRFEESVRTE